MTQQAIVKMIGKKVLIKMIQTEEVVKSGIILQVEEPKKDRGEIVGVGVNTYALNIGDKVVYRLSKDSNLVKIDGNEYVSLDEEDIICVL